MTQLPHPYINPVWFGVAMADLNAARKTGNRKLIEKQRRRLRRMLRKYATHQDVADYAELHLAGPK